MTSRGVLISVMSSASFAAFAFLAAQANPLNGLQVWGWRTLLTVPGILFLLAVSGRWFWFSGELRRVIAQPRKLLAYAFTAPMLGFQMWLFGWAPQAGHALEVTLGYFLLPLVMVLVGAVIFKEKLTHLSAIAAAVALLAVIYEVWRSGGIGWPTLAVALGYPSYFVVRRIFQTDGVGALAWEMALSSPLALWYATKDGGLIEAWGDLRLATILLLLGTVSIVGMVTYVMAAKELPYTLFGLLSYVEPILVTIVAVIIGERIAPDQWPTFIGVWLAVLVLASDGVRALLTKRRFAFPHVRPWRRRRPRANPTEPHSWQRIKHNPRRTSQRNS
ncbi:MAG: EamA family transporter RarD [Actinomycetaceae bacterium]|nr:EamA family transporter RarD [Actinomycetaceae bacterium]